MLLDNEHPAFLRYWHPIAASDEISAIPLRVMLCGIPWVTWRDPDDRVAVLRDECPHRGAPLSVGTCLGDRIQCAYHGWTFAADGTCVDVPAVDPATILPDRFAASAPFAVTEKYGLVWIAPEEPLADLPALVDWDHDGVVRFQLGPQRWKTSAAQMCDNFLDLTHFPYLHTGSFSDSTAVVLPSFDVKGDDRGFRFVYSQEDRMGERSVEREYEPVAYEYSYTPPYFVSGAIVYTQSGRRQDIATVMQPESAATTRLYTLVTRTDLEPGADVSEAVAFQEKVADEDRWMLEHIERRGLELSLRRKASSGADQPSLALHRFLARIVESASEVGSEQLGDE